MAITVAGSGGYTAGEMAYISLNNARLRTAKVTFDSSYNTGGEALLPADLGLDEIYTLIAAPANGYVFEYDNANNKLKAGVASLSTVLNTNSTAVGNTADTAEDTLMTYTLPAATLTATNMGIRVTAWGVTANNADTKTLKFYFGSVVESSALTASIAGRWWTQATILKTGASTQDVIQALVGGATSLADANFAALTETDTAAIIIKLTGTASAANANDIIQEGMVIELLGVPGTTFLQAPPTTDLSLVSTRIIAVGR